MRSNILLIEDSEAISKSVNIDLQRNGYKVFTAATVTEGLSILSENRIELIIVDMDLKSSKIIDFTMNISGDGRYNLIPLIMLADENRKISKRSTSGNEGWIIKPFSTDKLLKTIRKFLL